MGDARTGTAGSGPALWFASLGAVVAWAVQLSGGWFLEEVAACGPATASRGMVLGASVETWVLALTAAAAVVALAAGLIGFRWWSRRRNDDRDPRSGREAFMAFAGMLSAGLFLPIIVMGGLQVLSLRPCSP
jgi:hypothetical protein